MATVEEVMVAVKVVGRVVEARVAVRAAADSAVVEAGLVALREEREELAAAKAVAVMVAAAMGQERPLAGCTCTSCTRHCSCGRPRHARGWP